MSDAESKIATTESWKNTPLPEMVSKLQYHRTFDSEEWKAASRGLIPEAMEDKWFVYCEGQNLYFHRSWSGACIFRVTVAETEHRVVEVLVNRDPNEFNSSGDAYDAKLLGFLIDSLLLGRDVPFPVPDSVPTTAPDGVFQHAVVGTAAPEIVHETRRSKPWWKLW